MSRTLFRLCALLATATLTAAGCGRAVPRADAARADPGAAHPGGDDRGAAAAGGAAQSRRRLRPHREPAPVPRPALAAKAVENIRNRGRLIVGLDIGSNLFSFRDPITGEVAGFDVDIAGEVARDIFGSPTQVEYRILSSADRISALQNNQVDIVAKTMTITCGGARW